MLIILMCIITIIGTLWASLYQLLDGDKEAGFAILLILIPAYIIGHYVLLTRKGDDLLNDLPENAKRSILYTNIIYWIVCLIVPILISIYFLFQYREVDKGIKWRSESLFGDNISLITKYDNGIKYQLRVKFDEPKSSFSKKYTVQLLDDDGFEIESFQIKDYTNIRDEKDNKIIGVTSDGSHWGVDFLEYLKIDDVDYSVTN